MTDKDVPAVPDSVGSLAQEIFNLIQKVHQPGISLGNNSDSYGKCVEAMWRAGYMAHEYVASELGVTGFQHSVSNLQLLVKLRGIEGPVMLVKIEDALYPQYDLQNKVSNYLAEDDTRRWLADEAAKLLQKAAEGDPNYTHTHPKVRAHWEALIQNRPADVVDTAE